MKKNSLYLTTTLAATAFLASSASYALGIGNIKLQSALNQNLKAEIALTLSDGENPADLKIGLAPITKFDEAGIPWTVFLSKIEFKTVTENGKTVIKLSSKEALKEPFLDFIVEIKSPKSNVFREFTTLVDPPENYKTVIEPKHIVPVSNLPQRFVTAPEKGMETLPTVAVVKARPKPKPKVQVVATPKKAEVKQPPVEDSKIVALEKQIAEMKQMLLDQNVQITALKSATLTSSVAPEKIPAFNESLPVVAPVAASTPVNVVAPPVAVPPVNVVAPVSIPPVVVPVNVVEPPAPAPLPVPPVPIVAPAPVANVNGIATILPPVIPTVTPTVSEMSSVVVPPVTDVVPPVVEPVKTQLPIESPDLMTEMFNLVETASADSYYYIAGATGSLLLGLLGFLRLRNRNKTSPEDEVITELETELEIANNEAAVAEDVLPATEGDLYFHSATASDMFNDPYFDGEEVELDEAALLQFEPLVEENKTDTKENILYKADVYCAYGSHDKAIALLQDEFKKHPDANDYALQLLRLYVSQGEKFEFKEFVHQLATLGKKENEEFWAEVTDIATDFHPEALFFMVPVVSHHENTVVDTFNQELNSDLNFDAMNFDEAMTEEQINDEFFKQSAKVENTKNIEIDADELVFKNFPVVESLDEFHADFGFSAFDVKDDVIPEKAVSPEFDAAFDLDFTTFDVTKETAKEEPKFLSDAEFDLDFTTFDVTKETAKEEPKFLADAEFDLDFTTFDVTKEAEKEEPKFLSDAEFDLDFTTFDVTKEATKEEPKFLADAEFDLDFTTFDVKELETETSAADEAFDFDFSKFTTEKEPLPEKIK